MKDEATVEIDQIADKYGLRLLVVFGSHGTARETETSDIDLGFLSETMMSSELVDRMMTDLAFLFRRGALDLVDLRCAVPLLAYEIACTGRCLYEKDQAFLLFTLHASARHADTRHLREARKQYLSHCIDAWTMQERIT